MLRPILFVFGWIFFVIGVIGAFLPILPTTPFLLLAGVCFNKSSPRFHAWLLAMPVFGAAMEDWRVRRVIRPRAKIMCSLMLLASLGFIWARPRPALFIKIPASLVMIGVGTFVVTRKSS
ncbi:MAG: YbaN family protein [Bacteriovoracia bacterium]